MHQKILAAALEELYRYKKNLGSFMVETQQSIGKHTTNQQQPNA